VPFQLSERQAKTVAVAVTIVAALVIIVAVLGLFWLGAVFLRTFANVFLPLAVGWVAALVFRPYYQWLRKRLALPGPFALVAVCLSMLLPLVAFFWFFGTVITEQVVGLVERLPDWWQEVSDFVEERWPQVKDFFQNTPTGQRIQHAFEAQQDTLLQGLQIFGQRAFTAGAGMLRGVGAVFAWAVLPVYFAFFLMASPKPADGAQLLPFLKPDTRRDVLYLFEEFVSIVVAFFRGQLIVAFLQGLLYAIGFSLAGLKYGFVLGLLLGLLNIIPYLGSVIGLSITVPLSYFQAGGGIGLLASVVVVFTVVQLIESYVLTPKIMGDRTGLHFMVIIIAIFFWGSALGGILGMILAIPLTAFLVSFWRLAKEKYIPEIV
jgi:predicted PurR-regulated permease PerM